jgi:hypothetical protein
MADIIYILHEDNIIPERDAKCIRFLLPTTVSPTMMESHIAAFHKKGWITRSIYTVHEGLDWILWKNNHICHQHCICNNWVPNTAMYIYPRNTQVTYVDTQEMLREFTSDMRQKKLEYGVSLYNF